MSSRQPRREFFACPNCGADVLIGSKVCRECGSDDTTGWQSSEEIDYQSLELPDDGGGPSAGSPRSGWWLAIAVLLILVLTWWAVRAG